MDPKVLIGSFIFQKSIFFSLSQARFEEYFSVSHVTSVEFNGFFNLMESEALIHFDTLNKLFRIGHSSPLAPQAL